MAVTLWRLNDEVARGCARSRVSLAVWLTVTVCGYLVRSLRVGVARDLALTACFLTGWVLFFLGRAGSSPWGGPSEGDGERGGCPATEIF